jgi:hypothetical protein
MIALVLCAYPGATQRNKSSQVYQVHWVVCLHLGGAASGDDLFLLLERAEQGMHLGLCASVSAPTASTYRRDAHMREQREYYIAYSVSASCVCV